MYVILPVLIIIAAFSKVIQEPVNKPNCAKLSPEEHRKYRNKVLAVIAPFPENTHHEQETTEQSEKMASNRTSGE